MSEFTTVSHPASYQYEDRKSVFIGEAFPVADENEALLTLASVRKKYPDANHHVYAYVLRKDSLMRFSDDREPQGTAGMPVLDSIRKRGITDVLVVVTRYFGGTLLGTGGLVHAYTEAANGALNAAGVVTFSRYRVCEISFTYADYQKFIAVAASCGFRTENIAYTECVQVRGSLLAADFKEFSAKVTEISANRAILTDLGEIFSA